MDKKYQKSRWEKLYYVGIDIGSTASEIASRLLDEGIDVMSEGVRVAATGYGARSCGLCRFCDYGDYLSWKRWQRTGGKWMCNYLMWVVRIRSNPGRSGNDPRFFLWMINVLPNREVSGDYGESTGSYHCGAVWPGRTDEIRNWKWKKYKLIVEIKKT